MPKISVIVPIYNVEKYLPRCIDSILAQTFSDFELWLVNDGSPDNCGKIFDKYAAKDNRINVIHKSNGGLSDARNVALDRITGEYISFIDSDDWVSPEFLAHFIEAMERNQADMAICNMVSVDETGKEKSCYSPETTETILTGNDVYRELLQPSAANKLYKASIFKTLRYPKGRLYEDLFIYPDILAQVKKIVLTGKADYFYFLRSDSIMHQTYTLRSADMIDGAYASTKKLEKLGQLHAANVMREFVYSQTALAFANLDKKALAHKQRLNEVKKIYDECYPKLMQSSISFRQRIRYTILRIFPKLHTFLYR